MIFTQIVQPSLHGLLLLVGEITEMDQIEIFFTTGQGELWDSAHGALGQADACPLSGSNLSCIIKNDVNIYYATIVFKVLQVTFLKSIEVQHFNEQLRLLI